MTQVTVANNWVALSDGESEVTVQVVLYDGAVWLVEALVATQLTAINDGGHLIPLQSGNLHFTGLQVNQKVYARSMRTDQPATLAVTKSEIPAFSGGRRFRTYREWDIATAGTFVIKAVVPVNAILRLLKAEPEEGRVRIRTVIGGTGGGVFGESLPIFSTNNMTDKPQPPYAAQIALTAGGTHDGGGAILDILRAKTSGNHNSSATVGADLGTERGIPPSTYYFVIELFDFVGMFRAEWEERP